MKKILEQIAKYNLYMTSILSVKKNGGLIDLLLDGKWLSTGDTEDIFKRVQQINRENGLLLM